ncbi:MAG: enoyl-CoA hydratase/isomerase family protein [Desulfobacterales bacterium]
MRVVVITGNSGNRISSGYDILSIPTQMTGQAAEFFEKVKILWRWLTASEVSVSVIAMINRYCFGAGLNLAMCCDIRIAADHVKAGMPPVQLEHGVSSGRTQPVCEVIGMARTREIF